MALGRQQSELRAFPSPPDELPPAVAAPVAEPGGPVKRTAKGRIDGSEAARAMAKRSAESRARRRGIVAWGKRQGMGKLFGLLEESGLRVESLLGAFMQEAQLWADAQRMALGQDSGGDRVNPDASAMLEIAATQRLFFKFWSELACRTRFVWKVVERDAEGNPTQVVPNTELAMAASRMGDAARQNMLAAFEIAARQAAARSKAGPADPHAALWAIQAEIDREKGGKADG
jgi:hypothetical protein